MEVDVSNIRFVIPPYSVRQLFSIAIFSLDMRFLGENAATSVYVLDNRQKSLVLFSLSSVWQYTHERSGCPIDNITILYNNITLQNQRKLQIIIYIQNSHIINCHSLYNNNRRAAADVMGVRLLKLELIIVLEGTWKGIQSSSFSCRLSSSRLIIIIIIIIII